MANKVVTRSKKRELPYSSILMLHVGVNIQHVQKKDFKNPTPCGWIAKIMVKPRNLADKRIFFESFPLWQSLDNQK